VFETPSAQNPFGTGGPASGCFSLWHTVAPFGPAGVASCTVRPETTIFVTASSVECNAFEGNGTTYDELSTCARHSDVRVAPTVTVDATALPVAEIETGPRYLVLPADNIFADPDGSTGWPRRTAGSYCFIRSRLAHIPSSSKARLNDHHDAHRQPRLLARRREALSQYERVDGGT
jgi:hypothetical protein